MAYGGQKQKSSGYGYHSSDSASLGLLEDIQKLAEVRLHKEFLTYDELLFSLRRWWSQYYRRPYKDPLLDSYTLEELAYEFYDLNFSEKEKAEEEAPAEIPKEEWDWAAEEEAKELAAARSKATPESDIIGDEGIDPSDLTDEEWAKKHDENVLINPSAEDVDSTDGDIDAKFGE